MAPLPRGREPTPPPPPSVSCFSLPKGPQIGLEGLASPPLMFTMTDEELAIVCLWIEELDAAPAAAHDMGLPVAAPPAVL